MGRAWLTTKEQMGYDKLTAIWRKASSLLASFDDELAWSMHSTYTRAGPMHVHGDRYIHTKHTHTHTYRYTHIQACAHTHTHRQAHTQTPPHAQQRQAIRLHYIKGTAKAEKQACILSIFGFCFCMLKPLISTVENYDSLKRFSFSTWLFLFSSLSRWLAIRRNIAKDPLGRKYPPRVQTVTWNPSAVFVKVISWAVRARRKYLYSLK